MLEAFFAPVDRFCERTTPYVMGQEVLNDWTHLAFFAACFVACYGLWRRGQFRGLPRVLALWIGVIGVASTSLHLYPIGLTYLADTTAIAVFMALYTAYAPQVLRGFTPRQGLQFMGAFLLATVLFGLPSKLMGQEYLTLTFLPSLAFMVWLATTAQPAKQRRYYAAAAAAFALSMAAHAADLPTCALTQGHGTHWLWHLCNGLMLGLLVLGLPVAKARLSR